MRPIFRWTIGQVRPDGFRCLFLSVAQALELYNPEAVVCYNCPAEKLDALRHLPVRLVDQRQFPGPIPAAGVAWKLYPSRLDITRHELCLDNDVILNECIQEITTFLRGGRPLVLEGSSRTYGRFTRHVPPGVCINSGLYGLPPGFDLQSVVNGYAGHAWQHNATGEHAANITFDEQGIIAMALAPRAIMVPQTTITDCQNSLIPGKGHHFIGLNRWDFHRPFRTYLWGHRRPHL